MVSRLLEKNRLWARDMQSENSIFFEQLSEEQRPPYLWIGCADSRVVPNQATGALPGELFVHRNIANLIVGNDVNGLSVIQYAVDVLKVSHIMVVGHYGCGGVQAAWDIASEGRQLGGPLTDWLAPLVDLYKNHLGILGRSLSSLKRWDLCCKLNVLAQVVHCSRLDIVQAAWRREQPLVIHGWIYQLKTGLIEDLAIKISRASLIQTAYQQALSKIL